MSDGQKPKRIRAIVTNDYVDYPHNDIANAAWFFRDRLTKALKNGERRDGIFLDMMALITMIAFALEGYVNFVGLRLIESGHKDEDTPEASASFVRQTVREKIKIIGRLTGIKVDWNQRPYVTVGELVGLRNTFAHPKAHRPEKREFEAVGTEDELKRMLREYRPEYERQLTWDFVNIAYDDVEQIWNELLAGAKIKPHETWSGGSQGLKFLEHVEDTTA